MELVAPKKPDVSGIHTKARLSPSGDGMDSDSCP